MPGKVRRIVTAVNDAGRSYILSDTRFPPGELAPGESLRVGLWVNAVPASNRGTQDPVPDGLIVQTPPPKGGALIRITDYPPDAERERAPTAADRPGRKTTPDRLAKHPGFHATDTIDFGVVVEPDGPVYNEDTFVYVRVRNRGNQAAGPVTVGLFYADPATSLAFPADWNDG